MSTSTQRSGRVASVPPFEPISWLSGPHLQTVIARYWPFPILKLPSTYSEVEIGRGDRLSVLKSVPEGWSAGDPTVVMVHGLGGCARSPYVVRIGHRLVKLGVRVVRMNLRSAGSGFGLARSFYHSGLTSDVRAVAAWLSRRAPGSPIGLIGFSLGANLVLKLAGEASESPVEGLDCVVAANPPLDLSACCRHIRLSRNRLYDRNFVKLLRKQVARLHSAFPDLEPIDLSAVASLYDFDERYTAPRNGFRDAEDYYTQSSAAPWISRIEIPGLVIHAEDDPFIPVEPFRSIEFPPQLALELISKGGHLGYLSRNRHRGDRRWLDSRISEWLATRWGLARREQPRTGLVPITSRRPENHERPE